MAKSVLNTIAVPDRFTREWIESQRALLEDSRTDVYLDFSQTTSMDTAAAAWLAVLHRGREKAGARLVLQNVSADVISSLQKFAPPQNAGAPSSRSGQSEGPKETLIETAGHALSVLVEMFYWGSFGLLRRRDIREGALSEQMYQLGYRAIGIVGLLSLLIGIVLALQSAMQLRQFGADIFLAPMIGISMIRELGPLLTAIILAGRSGSATTAEIATMGVQEEIDALKTLAINPIQFIVVPKFWAISLTMPLLSVLATAAGIAGGFLVAFFYLDMSARLFWGELAKNIYLRDFLTGFSKSLVFAWLIVWIGSHYGFRVRGGAEEVGRATTSSVVACIFVIIIADALFSFVI